MFDLFNSIIAVLSVYILLITIYSIRSNGINTYNIFLFIFYFCLLLNTSKISIYQKDKSISDIYYFFCGPLAFLTPIYFFEKVKRVTLVNVFSFDVKYLFLGLLFIYILLKLYISSIVGWRIDQLLTSSTLVSGDSLSIPGFSGLALSIQWTLLMLTPLVPKKYQFIFSICLILFAILHVKRGDILRMFIFYLICYIYKIININHVTITQGLKKALLPIIVILFTFIMLGNIRQEARGDNGDNLVHSLGLKVDNTPLAWVYSYFIINYDVLRMYYDVPASNMPNTIIGTFMGEEEDSMNLNINGFNASTFLKPFIVDFKEFFLLEIFAYGVIVGFLILLAKSLSFNSLYLFICSLMFLSPFGNYFQSRAIFISMFFIIIINSFITTKSFKS